MLTTIGGFALITDDPATPTYETILLSYLLIGINCVCFVLDMIIVIMFDCGLYDSCASKVCRKSSTSESEEEEDVNSSNHSNHHSNNLTHVHVAPAEEEQEEHHSVLSITHHIRSMHESEVDQLHKEHDEHDRRLRKKHEMLRKKTKNRVQERLRARTALSHSRTLQKTKLFHDLPAEAIAKIINVMELRTFEKEDDLVTQGAPASEFMVVMKGAATVFRGGTEVRHLGSLDFLGEGALVNEFHVRGATVTADAPSSVLVLSFDRYQELLVDGTIAEETHERASRMSRSYTAEDAKRVQVQVNRKV